MAEDKVTAMLDGLRERLAALVASVRAAREELAHEANAHLGQEGRD